MAMYNGTEENSWEIVKKAPPCRAQPTSAYIGTMLIIALMTNCLLYTSDAADE